MKTYDVIFWDLDGTLIDTRQRLYTLFRDLTGCSLSYDAYWHLKAQELKQKEMLTHVRYHGDLDAFRRLWLQNIESQDYLDKDTLVDNAEEILRHLSAVGCQMYIVTNRQFIEPLLRQLRTLEIYHYFAQILTTAQKCTKSELIQQNGIIFTPSRTVFIGDSAEDMDAAKALGIASVLIAKENKTITATHYIKEIAELKNILL